MSANLSHQVLTRLQAQVAVQQGIAFLDIHGPADWRDQIDLERLDILSPDCCVLGQLYGLYHDGMHRHGMDPIQAAALGFTVLDHEYNPRWAELTHAWQEALTA